MSVAEIHVRVSMRAATSAIRSAGTIAGICKVGPLEEPDMRRGLALLGREDIDAARALAEARLETGNVKAAARVAAMRLNAA